MILQLRNHYLKFSTPESRKNFQARNAVDFVEYHHFQPREKFVNLFCFIVKCSTLNHCGSGNFPGHNFVYSSPFATKAKTFNRWLCSELLTMWFKPWRVCVTIQIKAYKQYFQVVLYSGHSFLNIANIKFGFFFQFGTSPLWERGVNLIKCKVVNVKTNWNHIGVLAA